MGSVATEHSSAPCSWKVPPEGGHGALGSSGSDFSTHLVRVYLNAYPEQDMHPEEAWSVKK